MSNRNNVLTILQRLLGTYRTVKDEVVFKCPKCQHRKHKLQVNLDNQAFQCWVCNFKGRSLSYLAKDLGASKQEVSLIISYYKDNNNYKYTSTSDDEHKIVTLPPEYQKMYERSTNFDYNLAFNYLINRGVTVHDMVRYSIGFCPSGEYKQMIIIPSYDFYGKLNYFVARSYITGSYIKYKMPKVSKDVVLFDLFINWNEPIVLVEGIFDAIAVRKNAIPLLGKVVLPTLMEKIEFYKPNVVIALDSDARADSIKLSELLFNKGIKTKVVDLNGKDPSEEGFKRMDSLIGSVNFGDIDQSDMFEDLIKLKLSA